MDCSWVKVLSWLLIVIMAWWSQPVEGCHPKLGRNRRSITLQEVTLRFTGCTIQTHPLRQLSFCLLGKGSPGIVTDIDNWYKATYQDCLPNCTQVRLGTRGTLEISDCWDCFQRRLNGSSLLRTHNDSTPEIRFCTRQHVYAALRNELPTFLPISNFRDRITFPRRRPANNWWPLTVKLPCKPPLFQVWNAHCLNLFANDVRPQNFVRAQNRLTVGNITFLATFSDACRFNVSDIDIVWSRSVPAFGQMDLTKGLPFGIMNGWQRYARVTCYTCHNVESEGACRRRGKAELCQGGEVCQSEVRQIDHAKQAITKSCKQAEACENNFLNNNRLQCRPGQRNSVCRCCCSKDFCNGNALHCA